MGVQCLQRGPSSERFSESRLAFALRAEGRWAPSGYRLRSQYKRGLQNWGGVPSPRKVQGVQGKVDFGAGDLSQLGAVRTPRSPCAHSPEGPPTCRLSAHGCGGGGGGGSSGLRKTCGPRLRNWTTAMRMWCSTKTMLAATRPPAGPAAAPGQRVRDSFAGSAGVSAPAPPPAAPGPAPARPLSGDRGQHLPAVGPPDPTRPPPGLRCRLPPSPDSPSLRALRTPPGSRRSPSLPSPLPNAPPFTTSQGSQLRAPALSDHILSPPL